MLPLAGLAGIPQTVTFERENMTYAFCPITVRKALEKIPGVEPDEFWPGPGLTSDGSVDKKSLVIRGWQRAVLSMSNDENGEPGTLRENRLGESGGGWAALFGVGLGGDDFPGPTVIYAANPDTAGGAEPSQRPFETITPLAARLNLTPFVTYAVGQEPRLVAEIVNRTGVVLVCWEHKAIVSASLPAIAGGQPLPGMPKKWDGARFDVVLRFDRSAPGAPWSFRQLFPRLQSGDSDTPLK